LRPIFCGLGLGLEGAGLCLGLGLGTAGLGLCLGLEVSVFLELFFKTTHVFSEPISYGCLLLFASYSSNKISNITALIYFFFMTI